MTGYTGSHDFPTVNALYPNLWGDSDAFIFKLSADGSQAVYSTYLGGSNHDDGHGIAVDSSGNAYVTGYTQSSDFPTVNALYPNLWGSDAFIFKLSSDGSQAVYSTYLGGHEEDHGYGIAVDSSGNAYVTGCTHSSDFPTTWNALYPTHGGGWYDAFIFKLSADGSQALYSTYLGGNDPDYVGEGRPYSEMGFGIAVDSSGNAYVTGNTQSSDFPTLNALYPNLWGDSDAFIFKLSELPYFFPVISQVPNSGPPGTTFTVWGTDFTPNGTASLFMQCPWNPIRQIPLDNEGHFEITFTVPLDQYAPTPCSCWAIDDYTGSYSNETFYEITEPLIYEPQHQLEYGDLPAKTPTAKNLVLITHGWKGDIGEGMWTTDMANSINGTIKDRINSDEWDVWTYDWSFDARKETDNITTPVGIKIHVPFQAFVNAISHGKYVGQKIAGLNYDHIHFIAHSAGSALIDTAASWIKAIDKDSPPTIHCTFLDAYDPRGNLSPYGLSAIWAEQYVDTRPILPSLVKEFDTTDTYLQNCYNFDVTPLDPLGLDAFFDERHAWPHKFYQDTIIKGPLSQDFPDFGFALSLESGNIGWTYLNQSLPPGDTLVLYGENVYDNIERSLRNIVHILNDPFDLYSAWLNKKIRTSVSGTVTIDPSIPSQMTLTQGSPVWMSMEFEVIDPMNILSLDYEFLSSSDGLLSVFFDNGVVSKIDERVAFEGTNEANSIWLGKVEPGTHVLSFRLDSFTGGQSVVEISNVRTGIMKAIPTEDATIQTLQDLLSTINNLDDGVFKNKNTVKTLKNKINAILKQVDGGLYQGALGKMVGDILSKTNGCAEGGVPDKNDWIVDCEAQNQVYPLVIKVIELLGSLS